MNLEFAKKSMEYLRPVLREVKQVEETAEAIIPDTCPDVQDILLCCGTAFLRGKELSEGMLTVSAGVSATALAKPEGRDTPEVVEVYIPMSMKLDSAVLHTGQAFKAEVAIRRLDGHLVNPRKVMVRATVAISVWVYQPEQEEHLEHARLERVQLLKRTAPIRCLKALGEKSYTVEDQVHISQEGNGRTICAVQLSLRHTDSRIAGNRAVLKGLADVDVLYLDDKETLQTGSGQIGFSQYIDLERCDEQDELRLISSMSGADVTFSSDRSSLNVILQIVTVAEVWGKEEIEYIGDMYSLSGELIPEFTRRRYESLVDTQLFGPVTHGTGDGVIGQPLYAVSVPGDVHQERNGEQVTFTLPITTQVLYKNADGALDCAVMRAALQTTTTASGDSRFEVTEERLLTQPSGDGALNVKISGTLGIRTFCDTEFEEITGGTWEEREEAINGPGLVIRRLRKDEALWDLAKAYHTTMEAIVLANGLETETVPEKLLLIPRGR